MRISLVMAQGALAQPSLRPVAPRLLAKRLGIGFVVSTALTLGVFACGDNAGESSTPATGSKSAACINAPKLEKDAFCETCQMSPTAQPAACKAPRTVNACCAWVAPPSVPVARGLGLKRYSDPRQRDWHPRRSDGPARYAYRSDFKGAVTALSLRGRRPWQR